MLEEKDFKKIGEVIDKRAQKTEGKIRKEFGEVIEQNIAPVLDNMDKRLGKVEKGLKIVRATMVTKDYFDDRLADLRGDIIILLRKEDRRIEYLIGKLREKNILDDKDIKKLESAQIFARQ